MRRGKVATLFLVLFLIPLNQIEPTTAQTDLTSDSLIIRGDIIDNYANLTYSLVFDNSNSNNDVLLNYPFAVPEGLFLSNISASMGDLRYWGQVKELSQAQQEFSDAIDSNQSAILVTSHGDYYTAEIIVLAETILYLDVYVEGFLARVLGSYEITVFENLGAEFQADFELDIDIKSSYTQIITARLEGVGDYERTTFGNGKNLFVSQINKIFDTTISLRYVLNVLQVGGEIITHTNGEENYFAYLFAPQISNMEEVQPREYIFVIDVSGSMDGNRIANAKLAFITMMETLTANDLFNVLAFSTDVNSFYTESHAATTTNIDNAVDWVNNLSTGGSTNINDGLLQAMNSFVGVENVKVVVFLSDGDPTYGITDTETIQNNLIQANTVHASIYSIALGSGTDEGLMASLAYDSDGDFVVIGDNSDVVESMIGFFDKFSLPVALGVSIQYSNAQSVYPSASAIGGAIFNGSEIIQTGKFTTPLEITTTIKYAEGDEIYHAEVSNAANNNPHVELLWAHNTIKQLIQIIVNEGENVLLREEIISLAINYGIVVRGYTGLIIVLEIDQAYKTMTDTATYDAAEEPGDYDQDTADQDAGFAASPFNFPFVFLSVLSIVIIIKRKNQLKL